MHHFVYLAKWRGLVSEIRICLISALIESSCVCSLLWAQTSPTNAINRHPKNHFKGSRHYDIIIPEIMFVCYTPRYYTFANIEKVSKYVQMIFKQILLLIHINSVWLQWLRHLFKNIIIRSTEEVSVDFAIIETSLISSVLIPRSLSTVMLLLRQKE